MNEAVKLRLRTRAKNAFFSINGNFSEGVACILAEANDRRKASTLSGVFQRAHFGMCIAYVKSSTHEKQHTCQNILQPYNQ